ncbi:hypothetical protein AOC05_00360 [Arthrobacter alpinus]|uniref:Uncharacterized protein n=1 Tax=Arthrobacter alpinus TaxID=656366 RepID=A0A0M4RM52_9MICC|nr:hypothetical protein AOC05_00360 [Arthrobacter alpinus]
MSTFDAKIEALRIRRDIESIALTLWANASGLDRSMLVSKVVDRRLVLLVAQVEDHQRLAAFRAARQAGHVYSETSDVLHGRTRGARFGAVQIGEWDKDLQRLRSFISETPAIPQSLMKDAERSYNQEDS